MMSQVKLNTKVCLFWIACVTKRNHDIKLIRNHHRNMNDIPDTLVSFQVVSGLSPILGGGGASEARSSIPGAPPFRVRPTLLLFVNLWVSIFES